MSNCSAQLELVEVACIVPFDANARVHSRKQIDKIAKSMKQRGVTNPPIIDEDNILLAGHGRLAAARKLGLTHVPCVRVSNWSDQDKRAYRVADNQIAAEASWDFDLLSKEFKFLASAEWDMDLTGFDQADIDLILSDHEERSTKPSPRDDAIPPLALEEEAVSRTGDLWELGNHRLICGNARDQSVMDMLMSGEKADMAFTDPPYNVPISGHVCGNGKIQHREFAEASGEMSREEFVAFLIVTLGILARACRDGAIGHCCMDWRHLWEILAAGQEVFSELKNVCVWNKTNAGMGTFYRSQHELVTVWKIGDAPHTNNFGLGERGRHRSNVWNYAGVNSFRAGRMDELALHPTVKPVAMLADAIRDVSHRGDIVLDPFGGSGTTLIAADKTGRKARLIELDPLYCDVIIRRWEKQTGKQARLIDDGRTFEEIADERVNADQELAA